MTTKTTDAMKGYRPMKKILLVAVLAVVLVLAFATTASARPNPNIYIEWDSATVNGAAGPHAGYVTASEKCNVCHAVHYAATADFDSTTEPTNASYQGTWSTVGVAETEMLLRSSVADACNYCHIDTAVGGVQIWGGDSDNYDAGDPSGAFSHSHAACVDCHAVHGASPFKGGNESKILRVRADRPIQSQVLASTSPAEDDIAWLFADQAAAVASADKYLQQVAFCTQCHKEYTDASETTITGAVYYTTTQEYKGHPMVSTIDAFSAQGDTTAQTQVAWVDSQTCRQCHDAGGVDQTGISFNSFPHYTRGYFRFQTSLANAGATDANASTLLGDAVNHTDYATDGNCLKCHVNAAATEGVGLDY